MKKTEGSSYINHFLQPDSIIPDWTNPQALNRYAYTLGNPVRYNDPSGHMIDEGQAGNNKCTDSKYCKGGKPKPSDELKKMRDGDGSGDKPLYSLKDDDDIPPCLGDPTCDPFIDKVYTEDELQKLIDLLGSYQDNMVGGAILAGVISLVSAELLQLYITIPAGLLAGELWWESQTSGRLITYLTDAKSVAQKQGGIRITMSHRDNSYGGVPVVIEYEGATTSFVTASPGVQAMFDVDH